VIKLKDLLFEEVNLPDIVYHGSGKDFDKFDKSTSNFRGTIYFTSDKNFAKEFAEERGTGTSIVYHCKLSVENVFDYANTESLNELKPVIKELIENKYKDPITGISFRIPSFTLIFDKKKIENPTIDDAVDWYLWRIQNGSWRILEGEKILNFIQKKGYDALLSVERGAQNIAVFNPEKIEILKKEYLDPNTNVE
jgi:hypothetical protein